MRRINNVSNGSFDLTTVKTPEDVSELTHVPEGDTKRINAKQVIIAAAANGAKQLVLSSPALIGHPNGRRLWGAVNAVEGMSLLKINLYFDKPWWAFGDAVKPPVQFGPNFTDRPSNSVYPFYSLPVQTRLLAGVSAEEDSGIRNASAALTVYCDFHNTDFWQRLQNTGELFTSPLQKEESQRRPQRIYSASKAAVARAKEELRVIFGASSVPEPVLTSFRNWNGMNNFESAYHLWKQGENDVSIRHFLAEPIKNVYFCNSAYSDKQAWVDGSIRSANEVLKKMDVPPLPDGPCTRPRHSSSEVDSTDRLIGLWGG